MMGKRAIRMKRGDSVFRIWGTSTEMGVGAREGNGVCGWYDFVGVHIAAMCHHPLADRPTDVATAPKE